MSEPRSEHHDRIPEEIRALCTGLCRDIAALHLKWNSYLELFGNPEAASRFSDTAPAFFLIVAESLRHDIVQSICRLGDPSRALGPDNLSLATLVAKCHDVPHVEDLLTAFQAACGPVRRHRHRHLGHDYFGARIGPREDLLPDVGRAEIDEILRLVGGILQIVHAHFSAGDPPLLPAAIGGAGDLIHLLKMMRASESGAHGP